MIDHAPFLRTIARNPADDGPRLVFADWLEERGDPHAEYIRLAIELARLQQPRQDEPPLDDGECWQCFYVRTGGQHTNGPCRCSKEFKSLRRRCAALLAEHRREWTMAGLPDGWDWIDNHEEICLYDLSEHGPEEQCDGNHLKADFARGFPEILTLRWEEWQRHYQTLIDSMPVRIVNLTNRDTDGFVGLAIVQNRDIGDGFDDETILDLLAAKFPGHDSPRPIRYTLPAVETGHIRAGTFREMLGGGIP